MTEVSDCAGGDVSAVIGGARVTLVACVSVKKSGADSVCACVIGLDGAVIS